MSQAQKSPEAQLYAKLQKVQQNCQNIPENGYNDYSKYKYPLFSDIIDTLKPELEKQNLFLHFTVTEHEEGRSSDGKKNYAKISMRATVFDTDSGYALFTDCPGYSEDTSDKASYQAVTNSKKYATLSLFGLRVGLDQETPKESDGKAKANSGSSGKQSRKPNNNDTII